MAFKLNRVLFYLCSGALVLSSCNKHAGPGGNSAIRGTVTGLHISNSKDPVKEITTITFTEGAVIDDNDYWILNSANGNQYYVWYDNTNWLGGDPALNGRTGVKVTYDFYQSNTDIANNTLTALTNIAGSDFTFSINNDVITITDNTFGFVPDAEDVNTPFGVDVADQGESSTSGSSFSGPMADQRVYLIYDDEEFYSDDIRTNENGEYEFKGLRKGKYRIYALSKDTTSNGSLMKVEVEAEITKNKSIVDASDLSIVD